MELRADGTKPPTERSGQWPPAGVGEALWLGRSRDTAGVLAVLGALVSGGDKGVHSGKNSLTYTFKICTLYCVFVITWKLKVFKKEAKGVV